ncbi:MAG: ATP-binding cassette domain-containing protein [Clostridia bacterium]|nr:ATP-binding cassette domain-containing protein [Clostridia bacterium]
MKNKEKQKYSHLSSIKWAYKKLWNIERKFIFYTFADIPFLIASPLIASYFSKVLIDAVQSCAEFKSIVNIVISFIAVVFFTELIYVFLGTRFSARRHYPTSVFQTEMSKMENSETDYEITETQEYKKIKQYAFSDATGGKAAVEFIAQDTKVFLTALLGIIVYGYLLGSLNPFLFLVVAFVSLSTYFTTRMQPKYYEKNKHNFEKESRKISYLSSISSNLQLSKDIKLYGMEKWLDKLLSDYQSFVLFWNKKCSFRGFIASLLSGLMTLIQNGAAYIFLTISLFSGNISVGEFVFYFSAVGSVAKYLQNIIGSTAKLASRAEKIEYYRDFYSVKNKFNYSKGKPVPTDLIEIEFRNVWYKYDGADDYTLKNINFTINKGESIAMVGLNGAGKTTLIKLICGFYSPTKGKILINGKEISEFNINEYYSLISAVFQEIKPVAFTMYEFVASSDLQRNNSREEAVDAMIKAGIYDKIKNLPNGIDTHLMKGIHDDGVDLSGGEMQKLLLARAIYKNGPILILDEPTAALDPIAENNLYLQYKNLNRNKTSVFISHRFASTRFCDRIILLDEGEIKEAGTHDELMALKGKYAHLFSVQSKYYKEDDINEE